MTLHDCYAQSPHMSCSFFPHSNVLVFEMQIKTTSPEKYKVRPTIGILADRAVASVSLGIYPGVSGGSINRDRFQVQVSVLPPSDFQYLSTTGSDSDSSSNFTELNNAFKVSNPIFHLFLPLFSPLVYL